MITRSETATQDGATVELGTIEHEGRAFTAMGAIVDVDRGLIVGYPNHRDGGLPHRLRTWNGELIALLEITGRARGFNGAKLTCYAMSYAGRRWHGRGLGNGMSVTMRAGRLLTDKEREDES